MNKIFWISDCRDEVCLSVDFLLMVLQTKVKIVMKMILIQPIAMTIVDVVMEVVVKILMKMIDLVVIESDIEVTIVMDVDLSIIDPT